MLLGFLAALPALARAPRLDQTIEIPNVVIQQLSCRTQSLRYLAPRNAAKNLDICFINDLPDGFTNGLRLQDGHADLRTTLMRLKREQKPVSLVTVPDDEHIPSIFEARTLPSEELMEITEIKN